MSLAQEFAADALELISEFGGAATLVVDGVQATVTAAGPVDESQRYSLSESMNITATFYVAASGASQVPGVASDLVYAGRTYRVIDVFPYSLQGQSVAWRLDVGEVGQDG